MTPYEKLALGLLAKIATGIGQQTHVLFLTASCFPNAPKELTDQAKLFRDWQNDLGELLKMLSEVLVGEGAKASDPKNPLQELVEEQQREADSLKPKINVRAEDLE